MRHKNINAPEAPNEELALYRKRVLERRAAATRLAEGHPLPTDPSAEELESNLGETRPDFGGLASNSIMNSELVNNRATQSQALLYENVVPPTRLWALDPRPRQRRAWERRKVIQDLTRTKPLPRHIQLARTERALTVKSPFMRTSMKKLSPLANQIQGKTIDEAILQMQFSRKRPAVAIKQHLEYARDQAIVERGMGLGQVNGTAGEATRIRLKDGTQHEIRDRTGLYVARAWVGKGAYGRAVNRRARGRIDMLRLPQTSISVMLKEETTRIREHREREAKEAGKKPWIQMPNRPLVGQRPYYTW